MDHHNTSGPLSETQFGTLETLIHLGDLNKKTIGEKLLISKSNVVAIIDKLEATGRVRRERCEVDRRNIFMHFTNAGQKTLEELLPIHVASIVDKMSCLTAAEQEELGRLCRKLGLKEA